MQYSIHLINKARDSRISGWTADRRASIVQHLGGMFAAILGASTLPEGCPYRTARARFDGGTIRPEEVACVIHGSRSRSIIAARAGQGSVESRGACYRTPQGMIAEIYLDRTRNFRGPDLAALIMHELVHYKLDADPDDQRVENVHDIGGTGLHQSQQYQSNILHDDVRDLMAERLMHPVTPYIGDDWNLRRAS